MFHTWFKHGNLITSYGGSWDLMVGYSQSFKLSAKCNITQNIIHFKPNFC